MLNNSQGLWVSVDGGGTKTRFCACGVDGDKIYDATFGCANYKSADYETVRSNLTHGVQTMLAALGCAPDDVTGMIMGIAGCDSVEDLALYAGLMHETGIPKDRVHICNDTEVAYRALVDGPGVCVVAGTGSIVCAYGRDGLQDRVGGWGAPLSDMGSGYWIGAAILKRMIRWLDGIETQYLPLYDVLLTLCGKPREQAAGVLATMSVSEVASVAPLVFRFAKEGDGNCQAIIQDAAYYLVEQIVALCKRLHHSGELPIVTVGGLFQNPEFRALVEDAVVRQFAPASVHFLMPMSSPAEDGLVFARKRFSESKS